MESLRYRYGDEPVPMHRYWFISIPIFLGWTKTFSSSETLNERGEGAATAVEVEEMVFFIATSSSN